MDNIASMAGLGEVAPEDILARAIGADLEKVTVVGLRADGTVYLAMSIADPATANWMLDCAKRLLTDGLRVGDLRHG